MWWTLLNKSKFSTLGGFLRSMAGHILSCFLQCLYQSPSILIFKFTLMLFLWQIREGNGVGVVGAAPSELISGVLSTGLWIMCDLGILILMALLNISFFGVRITKFLLIRDALGYRGLFSYFLPKYCLLFRSSSILFFRLGKGLFFVANVLPLLLHFKVLPEGVDSSQCPDLTVTIDCVS